MEKEKIKIVFLGTGEFALPILKSLIEDNNFIILAVATEAKDSQIDNLAQKNKIPILQSVSPSEFKPFTLSLFVVASFGKIIKKDILEIPKYGAINVHPSLLPKYRGSSPIQNAILNGDEETGVTFIQMDEMVDHGPIIYQEKINLTGRETTPILMDRLSELSSEKIGGIIPKYISKKITPRKQDENLVTFTKKIEKKDGKIDFEKSALEIEREIRAYSPWPESFLFWDKKRVKILEAEIINEKYKNIGSFYVTENKKLSLALKNKSLEIKKLQIEGKKEISGAEFINGYLK